MILPVLGGISGWQSTICSVGSLIKKIPFLIQCPQETRGHLSERRIPYLQIELSTQPLNGNAIIPAPIDDARRCLFDASIDAPLKVSIVVGNALPLFDECVGIGRLLNIDIKTNTAVKAPCRTQRCLEYLGHLGELPFLCFKVRNDYCCHDFPPR
jgi:hypothetical protein